jgi:hypothetical protein
MEWHRANLQRDRERLAAMLEANGPGNALAAEISNRIALTEKILAANDPQTP